MSEPHDDDMPPRMKRFLARPPKRIRPGEVAKRRNKMIRRSQPPNWLEECCDAQSWKCAYCRGSLYRKALPGNEHRQATLDHVHPISKGGRNQRSNVVAACYRCNNAKGSLSAAEFRALFAQVDERR